MARLVSLPCLIGLFSTTSIFFFFFFSVVAEGKPQSSEPHPVFGHRKEKLSHFRFYFHDQVSGRNATAVMVVQPPPSTTPTGFGSVIMIDDPLTEGPEMSSKLLGRAQGLYASASQNDLGLLMNMNFAFVTGKYNGSTLSIMGRNSVFSEVREMPVVGGSGLFRWARGYAQARTHKFDLKTGDAVVEYNVFVLHY